MPVLRGRALLQLPGPTNVPDRVLRAMARPLVDFASPEFTALARSCLDDLRLVFRTGGEVFAYVSLGHATWEVALANLVSPGEAVLVADTGMFARRWREAAEALGVEVRDRRRRLAARGRPRGGRGGAARGQGAPGQGRAPGPRRDLDRRRARRRGRAARDRPGGPPGAAGGGRDRLAGRGGPADGRGRRRPGAGRLAEGADAAARHGVRRGRRAGAARGGAGRHAAALLGLGRAAGRDVLHVVLRHAAGLDAVRAARVARHAARGGAAGRARAPPPAGRGGAPRGGMLGRGRRPGLLRHGTPRRARTR